MSKILLHELTTRGYIILGDDLSVLERQKALSAAQRLRYQDIFSSPGGPTDPHRAQAPFSRTGSFNAVYRAIQFALQLVHSDWSVKEAVALKSTPGGKIQGIHTDMWFGDVTRVMESGKPPPVAALLAVQSGTVLRVFSGCFGREDMKRKKDIEIEAGHLLLFRTDLAHCGMPYAVENIRFHAVVKCEGVGGDLSTSTFPVEMVEYLCPHSQKPFLFQKGVSTHLNYCTHPDKAARRAQGLEKRRRRERKPGVCGVCGEQFLNQSLLRKHREREHTKSKTEKHNGKKQRKSRAQFGPKPTKP